jgi:methyl-accepting chemotaxis protein
MPSHAHLKPLWIKVTACGFGAVLFCSFVIGGLAFYHQYVESEATITDRFEYDANFVRADMAALVRAAKGAALVIAGEPDLGELITANARDTLRSRFASNYAALKADGLAFITLDSLAGKAIVRIHAPSAYGDSMLERRPMLVQTLKSGLPSAGIEFGREQLSIFASVPVFTAGTLAGLVDVGTPLTNDYFAELAAKLHASFAVHVRSGLDFKTQNSTFTGPTILSDADLAAIAAGATVQRVHQAAGKVTIATGIILRDFSGAMIGILEIAPDFTAIRAAQRSALWSMGLASAGVCALVMAGFFVFARSLAGAIGRLTSAMGRLAAGEHDTAVPGLGRADEIGAMARAVTVFKDAAIAKQQLERDALAAREAAAAERARGEAATAAAAAVQAAIVASLAAGLNRLASGDLTCTLATSFPAEYERLRTDFNAASQQLREALDAIVANTTAIRSGSGEIAHAADDLSRRTEQQAASLEQTAAALDQITATVGKTAQGARQAQDVVAAAQAGAERSGQVVQDAVTAMSAIAESSEQIGQIIGLIDEIAFQTNLLALNAGIEAARVGEAGRGFAVVASEVRALAHRSTEAAKQIKALISTSSRQVGRGVELVGATGVSLKQIVAQVVQINGLVRVIAASAQEQATGLAEVNTAINQMDQVTQQNAAMVQQSSAASQALQQEAEGLSQLTGRFQLRAA